MKSLLFRRILPAGLLLLLLVLGLAAWLLGTRWGKQQLEQWVRVQLTRNSELVLAPFDVTISPWRDFPHLTASIRHISLTDTSFREQHPVLRVGRADMRLELSSLLRKQLRITRLTVWNVDFLERVDSLGRSWGLHGKRRHTSKGAGPPLDVALDSLLVYNFRIQTRNDFAHSAFGAEVQRGRLSATISQGVLRAHGTLAGELNYLRNSRGTLFQNKPVWAAVNYELVFKKRQGTLRNTRATLNGDTIRIQGSHTTIANQPGTELNFQFDGQQPLMEVLHAALPPTVLPFIKGATSPSKARIHYTISGLTSPTTRPRNILTFKLRRASLRWPDAARHINHWDLQATYDNGPAHNSTTTELSVQHCRLYSSAGRLNVALRIRDFTKPFVSGRFRGRTELPQLAAVLAPGQWRARHGTAEMDIRLHGLLPPTDDGTTLLTEPQKSLSVRGSIALRNASFLVLDRQADFSELNVRLGLQDSVWTLSQASGVLDRMRFQASATTVNLFDYLTGQRLAMQVTGNFAVDELRVQRLRELLRPPTATSRLVARQRAAAASTKIATLGGSLIPPGVRLHVGLRCNRLILAADTLQQLAATVLHDGQRVELQRLAVRVWDADVRGRVSWPTDTLQQVAPIQFDLGVHFDTINYRRLVARLSRPPKRAANAPASPALRELLLAANGQLTCDITTLQLNGGENLRSLQFQLFKKGPELRLPALDFATTRGGSGHASVVVQLAGIQLTAADVDLNLHYSTLDIQRLLLLLASLNPEDKTVPLPQSRIARRAERRARRQQTEGGSILTNGILRAVVRVRADRVNYGAVRGRSFELLSHLRDGAARVDNCSLRAFQGLVELRGGMLLNVDRQHHPLHVQMRLQDVDLSDLFSAGTSIGLTVPDRKNIKGTMRCATDLHTDLDSTFLPRLDQTLGYLKADLRDLELLNVEALSQVLKFMRAERTNHLFFEPFSSQFLLNRGQLLIPDLDLNSNLSNLEVSGSYFLDGRANLYVGLNPMQALFGDNEKRIERIQQSEPLRRPNHRLTYINLQRPAAGSRYSVRLFKGQEQREQQALLRRQMRELLITQGLDTTLRLLR
ncbi:AsmA-like C-terminal region-containing protein [Hymenobacter lucidus]|uniref:AsmA-like C-terminal region-containing protein n=1 Tax=Hymenobacter lucidus TaxID=2880930 RepID=A0ABS8ARQ5_9BACT|nr:AsmA-like C-terminal region-containing protein [Hymenobacter lucidus]MCB2408897.1 AsmA-like C-terminal region-containing protein [Hymenobacter lucidus]